MGRIRKVIAFKPAQTGLAIGDCTVSYILMNEGGHQAVTVNGTNASLVEIGLGIYELLIDDDNIPEGKSYCSIYPTADSADIVRFTPFMTAHEVLGTLPNEFIDRAGSFAHWVKGAITYQLRDVQTIEDWAAGESTDPTFSGTLAAGVTIALDAWGYYPPEDSTYGESFALGVLDENDSWTEDTDFTTAAAPVPGSYLLNIRFTGSKVVSVAGVLTVTQDTGKVISVAIPAYTYEENMYVTRDGLLIRNDNGPVAGTTNRVATESTPGAIEAGMGGVATWSAADVAQARYRLNIDGTKTLPSVDPLSPVTSGIIPTATMLDWRIGQILKLGIMPIFHFDAASAACTIDWLDGTPEVGWEVRIYATNFRYMDDGGVFDPQNDGVLLGTVNAAGLTLAGGVDAESGLLYMEFPTISPEYSPCTVTITDLMTVGNPRVLTTDGVSGEQMWTMTGVPLKWATQGWLPMTDEGTQLISKFIDGGMATESAPGAIEAGMGGGGGTGMAEVNVSTEQE